MSTTPAQRTLEFLRAKGYVCDKAEYWQPSWVARKLQDAAIAYANSPTPHTQASLEGAVRMFGRARPGVRKDLFEFIDIVAMTENGITAIQSTSDSNLQARVKKILSLTAALKWVQCNGIIQVWGWKKNKANRWEPRVVGVEKWRFLDEKAHANDPPKRYTPSKDPF